MINKKRGFTLIELMIALTVIGILSGILLPNFSKIRLKAKESAVKSAAHTLQLALESYALNQNGIFPSGTDAGIATIGTTLVTAEDLAELPTNPFTNAAYTDTDSDGKITYTYEDSSYTITAYGKGNASAILTLTN